MILCTKGVNMVKEILMDPDDIIEYVRNNVKVDDIFELSYNRVFAPGTVLGLTPEDEETGELYSKVTDINTGESRIRKCEYTDED